MALAADQPVEQPGACPRCGNPNLSRYGNAVSCGACQWSNARIIETKTIPQAPRQIGWVRAWLLKLSIHLFERISTTAKCPACGCREEHKIKWRAAFGKVLHFCGRCEAVWGELPIVQAADWAAVLTSDQPAGEEAGTHGTN